MFYLTRKYLEERGITEITKDGHIFKGDYEMHQFKIKTKHPYGRDREYVCFMLYDPEVYKKGKRCGQRQILVHRAVYAWYNGECPKNRDIDHIDNNPFNNCLDNLQAITRAENIRKRVDFKVITPFRFKKYKRWYNELKEMFQGEELCDFDEFAKLIDDYENQETFMQDMINEYNKLRKEETK